MKDREGVRLGTIFVIVFLACALMGFLVRQVTANKIGTDQKPVNSKYTGSTTF